MIKARKVYRVASLYSHVMLRDPVSGKATVRRPIVREGVEENEESSH